MGTPPGLPYWAFERRMNLQKNPTPVTAVTGAAIPGRAQSSHGTPALAGLARELAMLNLLTFTIVAVALGMPLIVPLMWGPIENA
jgi:hypothetical protein